MAAPNLSEIATTTMRNRSKKLRDNVSNNNALLARLNEKGRVMTFSGGEFIVEEIDYAENETAMWYSGAEPLDTQASETFSAATYDMKQLAVNVIFSGRERLQNSGKEKAIDLLKSRLENAEKTMKNRISDGVYSDGTGYGGKEVDGIELLVSSSPSTGTAGSINRATYSFWRNQVGTGVTAANIKEKMQALYLATSRGSDKVDLIVGDDIFYGFYWAALQDQQRFTNAKMASLGFQNLKFQMADVVFDGGIGGDAPDSTFFFLNTDYLKLRPHSDANMVPMDKIPSTNSDAYIQRLLWAGNVCASNLSLQGRLSA